MATLKPLYASAATLACALASLANAAMRQSAAHDNATSDRYVDTMVGGKVTTGTSPTNGTFIHIYAAASYDGTIYSGGASGSDAPYSAGEEGQFVLLESIQVSGTPNQTYEWGPHSIKKAFGQMPRKWSVVVHNESGVALNATGSNHEIKHTGMHFESVA